MRSKGLIHILVLTMVVVNSVIYAQTTDYSTKSVLAVFAHPDDEISVAPVLSKYAREGARVELLIVTDGRYGTGQTDLKPGEELVELRKGELDCSCKNLGIKEPITLGYHDQLKLQDGFFGHVPYAQQLLRDLDSVINRVNPDAIITWGPEGGSNHMDHRIVGASVTHVYLSRDRTNNMKLYYVGIPSENLDEEDRILRGIEKKYLNARIPYTKEDAIKTVSAMECYRSQFSVERMESRGQRILNEEKIKYLREFAFSDTVIRDLFE